VSLSLVHILNCKSHIGLCCVCVCICGSCFVVCLIISLCSVVIGHETKDGFKYMDATDNKTIVSVYVCVQCPSVCLSVSQSVSYDVRQCCYYFNFPSFNKSQSVIHMSVCQITKHAHISSPPYLTD